MGFVLDAVTQRQIALAAFVLILAVKTHHIWWLIYSAFVDSETAHSSIDFSVLIWIALDSLFIWALKAARVPRLNFTFISTLAIWAVLIILNILVGFVVGNVWLGANDNAALASDATGYLRYIPGGLGFSSDLRLKKSLVTEFNSSHIQGSHIVKIVPPTLAKLNPNNTKFCIKPSTSSATVTIPLQIKGTPPYTIDYETVDLSGRIRKFSNITVSANGESKRGVAVYGITIQSAGIWKLTGLRDSTGMEGRVIDSVGFTEVGECPDARWILSNAAKRTTDLCVGDGIQFGVEVTAAKGGHEGVEVYYGRKIGSEDVVVRLETEINDGKREVESIWVGDQAVDEATRKRIFDLKPQKIILKETFKADIPGVFFFRLLSVLDGRNNTLVFPDSPHHQQHQQLQASAKAAISSGNIVHTVDRKTDVFVIDSHSHPTVRFEKLDAAKIRASPIDDEFSDGATASLPVVFENGGTAPWVFTVSHAASIQDADDENFIRQLRYESEKSLFNMEVNKPGVYTIGSVSDAYCEGTVSTPAQNMVHQTFPPTIAISAESIEQSCVGTIGALVNVSLTGDAPFWIDYDEVYRGVRTRRTAHVNKLRDSLSFKPILAGTYLYEFQAVGDATYTEGIPIENVSITQIIHPQSEARFTNPEQKLTKCIGDSATLPVTLIGSGPWRLTYEIIFENRKERISVEASGNERGSIDIVTPNFEAAGSYVVDLIEITDANECSWLLETQDISIEVLSQRPSAGFTKKSVLMLEGDVAQLDLALVGRQPFNVKYINKANPENVIELRGLNDHDSVRISGPGTYEVVGVSDLYCTGTAKPTLCEVKTIPKPSLSIPAKEYESINSDGIRVRPSICQNNDDSFEVLASGKAPFAIKYSIDTVDSSNGKFSRVITQEESTAGRVGKIGLITDTPGTYLYSFNRIVDDNYRRPFGPEARIVALQQTILSRPNAVFVDGRERVFQCLGDNVEDDNSAVSIKLEGLPPFDLTLELKHENHPREVIKLNGIIDRVHKFRPPTLSATGKYAIQLVTIKDSSGCERTFDREDSASGISVSVSDVARIASLNPESVCVGDVLSYTLQGTPPFTISYDFDGVAQENVQIVDPLLTLYAAEPGVVRVTGVCNNIGCCTKPARLENTVHDLPSAIVDGGHDFVEDIREGDETVIGIDFLGVPPFSFTYARRDLNGHSGNIVQGRGKKESKSEESFTITGVDTFHYDITTSQEGLFHVTAVYDKHCGFPRVHQVAGGSNAILRKKAKAD
ncbi:hypothetical protein HK100_010973 [Physocladia obscura]|uniref:Uncharacterized protein n=1 Tax=Physocladia obscura TaxID=109957 RepID=A0AAD5XKA0_9FUNG|nr:hypothetical protein HK100_010973 [Physocladia obscura]